MQKKRAQISLRLKKTDRLNVKIGDKISQGDVILTEKSVKLSEFNLSKLLDTKPKDVATCLVIAENTPVKAGDLVAKKGGMFGKKFIKAPVDGTFMWVDKDTGMVGIKEEAEGEVVKAYFDGMVESVSDTEVLFSVSGTMVPAEKGYGKPVTGTLLVLPEDVTTFTLPLDIAQTILLLKAASSDLIAKADALGAVGILAEEIEPPDFPLSYLVLQNVHQFSKHHGATVILYGDKKELLILEKEKK